MREPEGGFLSRAFIGRHEEREEIKTRLVQDGGFLLLYGQPMVGKASLAMQVAEELQGEQESTPVHIYTVDCKDAVDWPGVMRAICRAFSFDETVANENLLVGAILQQLQETGGGKLLLLLLRMHLLTSTGTHLHSLTRCLQTLAAADVMTLVTSRRQLQLPVQKRVLPLTLNDALQLLRHHAPDVTATDFQEVLQRYCYGLPPLVLQVAQLVSGGSVLAFSAEELREALESEPDLLMQGLSEEAQRFFSALSPEVQSHVSTLAQLLDGHFSLEALKAVVGVEGARMKTVLRRLHDEAPLMIDNESQRMRIEPLVLHHVRKLGHVSADDPARLRVVSFLGQVLLRAERELYVAGQDTVYGHLHGDWPQLQHVLRQALHCTHHTYQAYLQVALKADKLLAKCFPHDALLFYQNMATAAVHFGTARDQAVLQGLIGMAVTLGQAGTGWGEALQYFHRALPVLQQDPRSVSYLRLLIDLGIAYFRLSHLQESDRYLSEAVSISYYIQAEDDKELIFHLLRARNFLALPCIFRGHLEQSKGLLLETLELCEQLAPHHPDKPVLINSLGLVFERSGEDHNKALHYYTQSLVERRRYAALAPGDLVPTLNNIGMQYSRRGDYDTALMHLQEAAAIRKRDNRWHYYTALTEQHIGQVYTQRGDYAQAVKHLEEAACVYARCTPSHDVRAKVALCLAHLYVTEPLRDLGKTQKYLKEVCDLSESVGDNLSDSGLKVLMTAVQHRMQLDGWNTAIVMPLLRWVQERISRYDGDAKQLAEHRSIIADVMTMLQHDITEDQKEAVTSRVLEQCQICGYLSLARNSDTRGLWRDVEQRQAAQRAAMNQLRGSLPLREVLGLASQYTSHSMPLLPHRSSLGTQQNPASPSLKGLGTVPFTSQPFPAPFSASMEEKRNSQETPSQQLGQVMNRLLKPGEGTEPANTAAGAYREPSLPQHRDLGVTRPTQVSRLFAPATTPTLTTTQTGRGDNTGHPEVTIPASYGLQNLGPVVGTSGHGADSDQYSSCSFTSSEPPSTTSSEAMSTGSPESSSSFSGRPQQEVPTMCERIIEIVPVQETAAQDQGNTSWNAEASSHSFQHYYRNAGGGHGGVCSPDVPGQVVASAPPLPPHFALSSSSSHPHPSLLNPISQPIPRAHTPSQLPSPAAVAEHSAAVSSSPASPPPQLTLEDVVTYAQQLQAVLPSTATSEQRMMLEKLASLNTSESGSSSSSQGTAARNEAALLNLRSLGDQAAKWSQLHSEQAQTSQETFRSRNVSQTPAWPSEQPRAVQDNQNQPSVQRLRPATQRGAQPFGSAYQPESAFTLTAARDQLEALSKMAVRKEETGAEQRQLSHGPVTATGSVKEVQRVCHMHSEDSPARHYSVQKSMRTLPPMSPHSVGTVSSSAHTARAVPSVDNNTYDTAFPEVRQEPTSSRPFACQVKGPPSVLFTDTATVTGSAMTGTVGACCGPPQSGSAGTDFRTQETASQGALVGTLFKTQTGSERAVYSTQKSPSLAASALSISSTELFGSGRQPTECDDDSSLPQTGQPVHGVQRVASTPRREAIENDERLDNPQHVCTSVNCPCSLKHRHDQP